MFRPDILTNGDTYLSPAHLERLNVGGRLEVAVFVEHIVGRKKGFVRDTPRDVALEQSRCVVKRLPPFFVSIDKANKKRSAADFFMEPLHDLNIFGNEAGLEEEILWWIARNREFRHEDKVSSGGIQAFVGLQDFVSVSAEISDGWVDLSKTDFHASEAGYALGQAEQWLLQV